MKDFLRDRYCRLFDMFIPSFTRSKQEWEFTFPIGWIGVAAMWFFPGNMLVVCIFALYIFIMMAA